MSIQKIIKKKKRGTQMIQIDAKKNMPRIIFNLIDYFSSTSTFSLYPKIQRKISIRYKL